MTNINCFLGIIVSLLLFFCVVLLYLKYNTSSFTDTHFLDSRYKYPVNPPVNPNVKQTTITRPKEGSLLNYSGGQNELLNIPLQFNVPNDNEQLRSQPILITPYNRIKYSNNC
jgi:hypothetical protein